MLVCGVLSEKNERRKRADFAYMMQKKEKKTKNVHVLSNLFHLILWVRYNHSLSIKCLEWDSEVPSPGSHSWWKPGPETTSPVSHWYGNFREEETETLGVDPSHNITSFFIYCFSETVEPLVMENSAAPKEADSCVIVIVNKNNTLWWTQFCL